MRTLAILALFGLSVAALGLALLPGVPSPHTPGFQDAKGDPLPGSVAELTSVEIGGMEQHLLIRGRDEENPVLLWVHGGPGAAQMPLAHYVDEGLERDFVVVHWDQRGAGKSNHADFNEATMTFQRFQDDALEVIEYLQERFDRDRVVLLGHSWGSQLGIELAARHPEKLHAYVGVSQVVDNHRAYSIGHAWLEGRLQEEGNETDRMTLAELGDPPYTAHADHVAFVGLVGDYGGNLDWGMARLARVALRAPEYGLRDYWRWLRGANRGSGPMWDELYASHFSYGQRIPRLEVPVFFLMGRQDYNTPHQLAAEYLEALTAPRKELVTFEASAHAPFLEETEAFTRALQRVRASVMEGAGSRR